MHTPALHGSATHLCPTPQHVHTHAYTWMDSALHWGLPRPPEPPASFRVSRFCGLWSEARGQLAASSRMTSVEHKKPQTQADSPGDGTGGQLHGPSHDETLAPLLPPQLPWRALAQQVSGGRAVCPLGPSTRCPLRSSLPSLPASTSFLSPPFLSPVKKSPGHISPVLTHPYHPSGRIQK